MPRRSTYAASLVLIYLVRLFPLWGLAVVGVAILAPRTRPWLAIVLFAVALLTGMWVGKLWERHLHPQAEAIRLRPWVPINTVVLDVAKALEDAQHEPRTAWFTWMPGADGRPGRIDIDYVRAADLAVETAARQAVKRKRSAAVRAIMDDVWPR